MALLLLSHGQDLDPVSLQSSWEDRVGDHGGARIHHAVVHNVLFAKARAD